jgi:hypothetical protein
MLARLGQVLYWAGFASAVLVIVGCASESKPKPANITIAVDKDGNTYWNGERVSCAELSAKVAALTPNAPMLNFCEQPAFNPDTQGTKTGH